ncbi:MAG: type II secretion system F family protein [Patescibacteria group bacterium]|nr:type II secretion system F family protein [Patescibacteria group bacterium]
MARYFYTAKSLKGESKSGILEAKDKHELARILRQEGYILIRAILEKEIKKKKFEITLPFVGVGLKEKLFFTRNLQVMITAGIPLPRSLKTLSEQVTCKKFKKVLENIKEEIIKGKSLSSAFSHHPDIFSELFQNMVKIGEEAGTLEEVLKVLAEQMEKENELKSKIKGALIYPAVIILAMIGIGILMLVMVVPKLAETFAELNIELPLTTQFVISLGNFLVKKWYLGILIIFFLLITIRMILKTKIGKRVMDNLTLHLPIISPIVKKTNAAYTARTLSSLIKAGVPIVRSLEIVSRALGNIYFKEAIQKASEKVKKGEKLAEAIRPYQNLYSPLVVQMLEVGEETGQTSSILAKLAKFFEEEVSNATKNLSAVIEPILMLLIGGVVGFFAISMIQPMYSMLGAIK